MQELKSIGLQVPQQLKFANRHCVCVGVPVTPRREVCLPFDWIKVRAAVKCTLVLQAETLQRFRDLCIGCSLHGAVTALPLRNWKEKKCRSDLIRNGANVRTDLNLHQFTSPCLLALVAIAFRGVTFRLIHMKKMLIYKSCSAGRPSCVAKT